jgi:PleD family two-component response regulator
VTCSVGLACWDFQEAVTDLVERADQALYAAKAEGRNRYVLA